MRSEFDGRHLHREIARRWRGRGGVRGFCRATGLQPSTVYAWFRGDALPELSSVAVAASALSMRCSDLVGLMAGEEKNQ